MKPSEIKEYIKKNNIEEVTLYSLEELKNKYRYDIKLSGAEGFTFYLDDSDCNVTLDGARIKVLGKKVKLKELLEYNCYVYGCFVRIPYEFINLKPKTNNLDW